jgi:protein arginine N-methyltransferase 5
MLLSSSQWNSNVIGKTSTWIDVDAHDTAMRVRSEAALQQEIAWAAHLGLSGLLLPPPRELAVNFARCVARALAGLHYLRLLVRLPLVVPRAIDAAPGAPADTGDAAWRAWNQLRVLCDHHKNLYPVLELTPELPSDAAALERWLGEPVQVLILPTSVFLANRHGFPVLPKAHQSFVVRMAAHRVQLVISGPASAASKGGMYAYHEYVRHLLKRNAGNESANDPFDAPYRDVLQAPLQPLQDNLESQTYETFERDPVKYNQYEEAVRKALLVHAPDASRTVVLMVVGAGRGPLVRASFRAAKAANRRLRVYAVEKNPNAVVTLMAQRAASPEWRECVTVVSADMRAWQAPELADILVSELLGSFGDNESSPECLDGAQKFLKPDGISIPSKYVSFAAPITSHRLYNEVRALGTELKHFETPYVVKLHNVKLIAPPQPCFTFVHPTPQPADNERYGTLSFTVEHDALLHGFSGYFDATLFDDVHVSIEPSTHSPDMFSWFPLFFPLRTPIAVTRGAVLTAHFWRRVDAHRMYYEWAVTTPVATTIHNPSGRSYYVGL